MEVKAKGKEINSKKNEEERLGGNIILSGFFLEPVEMVVIRKIIGTYAKKIGEKTEYQEIKVTLKQHRKAKMFLHEIKVRVNAGEILESSSEHKNLYTALSDALKKVYAQAEHKH